MTFSSRQADSRLAFVWGRLKGSLGSRTLDTLEDDLKSGLADVLPIGRWALANPDFIDHYRKRAPLNEADRATFYGGGAKGYTDYPGLAA